MRRTDKSPVAVAALLRLACIAWLALASAAVHAQCAVMYPAPESAGDHRFADLIELLSAAMDKTRADFGPCTVLPSRLGMNETRSLAELRHGDLVNVIWSSTSNEKESEFVPIRIPLRKGLLGYRIALIDAKNQARLDAVRSVADLQKLTVGQGFGWGDVDVYRFNGIATETASYESLFSMVAHDRFDLYPRGINEIFEEFDARKDGLPELAIERGLIVYYPWPYYFFVAKSNAWLAKRIELGLRRMIDDGSFDDIFWRYNGAAIRRANLSRRRILRLDNPHLPKETPKDAHYWFFPDRHWRE